MNQVLREEKKFLINIAEFRQKSHLLEQALLQDEHNGIHGYRIRSLYFDTPYDRDFFEKQGFNSYYAQDVYAYVVETPANYLSYFIGYLEIMDIKDAYQRQELDNYSEKEFHKRFLDVGPADFETVKKCILKDN